MKLYKVALAPNPTKVMLYIAEREQLGTRNGHRANHREYG